MTAPAGDTLPALVAAAVARWPEQPAVLTRDLTLSYGELDRLADQLAADLLAVPGGPGELVAVSMRKGWEQVVGTLAVVKAGSAYLPVDPDLPPTRIEEILALAEVRCVLSQAGPAAEIDWPAGLRVFVVDPDDRRSGSSPAAQVVPSDLAYVLFTSGSTGVPKGVMIEHAGVVNTLRDLNTRFDVGPGDRVLSLSSLSFDMSVYDIFGTLAAGAAVVLPEPALAREPAYWVDLMRQHQVTVWNTVPALFGMAVSWLEETGPAGQLPLRLIMLGGDWIPLDLPGRAGGLFPDATMVSLGGATEASICSVLHVVDGVDPAWTSIPYGRPMSGQHWYVLDEDMCPCPPSTPGDLYIGGAGVGRGYWRDPERTAAAFVHHPSTGERIYRTGDRGRWLPEGHLELLGRRDLQVKIHGYRIELGEVAAVLRRHPAVREAEAVAAGPARRPDRIVAFVLLQPGGKVDPGELGDHAAGQLPGYMVPAEVLVLDALPRTGNGKTDRSRLLALAELPGPAVDAPPATPTEREIAALWCDLFEVDEVGRSTSFFDLGGNSLVAAQLSARIRRVLGTEVSAAFAFHHPTVAEMASAVEAGRSAAPTAPTRRAPGDGPAPLTFGQEQLWFFDQLDGAERAYHYQACLRLTGDLDPDLLCRALTEVVARHEALRTTYEDRDGRPVQVVHPPYPVELAVEDLRLVPEDRRSAALDEAVRREIGSRFNLGRLPLIRWRLIRTEDRAWTLTEVEHHILHDGWSVAVFWREVEALYRAWAAGAEPRLPELDIQYGDYAEWQRRRYRRRRPTLLAFWTDALAGVRPLDLPTTRPRPARQTFAGATRRVVVPHDLYVSLQRFCQDHDMSPYMVLFGAYVGLLHRYTGETDLCIGSWLANRDDTQAERLIGMLVNMVAMRNRVTGEQDFRTLLDTVRSTAVAAYAHQDCPFPEVVRAVAPDRDPSRNPIVQTCFSLHDSPVPEFDWPGVRGSMIEQSNGSAKFDLNVVAIPQAEQRRIPVARPGVDELVMMWEYNTDLFDPSTVDRMIGHYQQFLRGVLAAPEVPIGAVGLLTEAEVREQARWQGPDVPVPASTVHDAVLAWATADPDAVAILYGEQTLSYGELAARVRTTGARLAAAGVRPGDLVAVCLDRSPELIATLLGVLAAGAAYVPLDPAHPAHRNRMVLAEAAPAAAVAGAGHRALFDDRVAVVLDPAAGDGGPDGSRDDVPADPGDLAYVLFTSGTTGRPKGVEVSHRSVLNLLEDMRGRLDVGPADVLTAVTTVSFDIAVLELMLPLVCGARVDIVPEDVARNGERLRDRLARAATTILQATPATWRLLAEAGPWPTGARFVALCGGETCPADLATLLAERSSAAWNVYGPTETTVWSTAHRITGAEDPVPIGRPLANTTCQVVDAAGAPVPAGVPGELLIGGAGVARGYLSRPELTAERFGPGPDGTGRVFRTGDVARWTGAGDLEFLGRNDRQVKLRGFRIELEEVESALRSHPAVRDATVLLRDGISVGPHLVAWLTGVDAEPAEVREFVRDRLPGYMMPEHIGLLAEFPSTANGKVDRAALARLEPPRAGSRRQTEPEPAAAATGDGRLARIWSEILGLPSADPDEDFFELGGHSLLALRLIMRVRTELNREVSLNAIFDHRTLRELDSYLGADATSTPG